MSALGMWLTPGRLLEHGEAPAVRTGHFSTSVRVAGITFDVLGPVGITVNGRQLPMPSAKMRYLTAALLLHMSRAASHNRLTEVLWNGEPPASARKNIHQYVHRLRRLLAPHGLADRLVRGSTGYTLWAQPGELDLDRFEALVNHGWRLRKQGDLVAAAASLARALELWRDDALVDVRDSLILDEAGQALTERRLVVLEERIGIDLCLGRYGELVPELGALAAMYPLRERLRAYQMIALHATGRTADALAIYHNCRQILNQELGVDPTPALTEVFVAVLNNDDAAIAGYLARIGPQLART